MCHVTSKVALTRSLEEQMKDLMIGIAFFLFAAAYMITAFGLYMGCSVFGVQSTELGLWMLVLMPFYPPGFVFWVIVLLVIFSPFILLYHFLTKCI